MARTRERIEKHLEENGVANLQQLVIVGEAPEYIVKSIANELALEGKVRSFAREQESGHPVYEWIGT